MPSRCLKPSATRRALYLSIFPADNELLNVLNQGALGHATRLVAYQDAFLADWVQLLLRVFGMCTYGIAQNVLIIMTIGLAP